MKRHILLAFIGLISILHVTGCTDFLDIVPDNIATIDNAFTLRTNAEKFLFTCYSFRRSLT